MNQHKILPFYMSYPLPMYYDREDTLMRDLEYLQQMYPSEAKKYQKRIAEILDRIDYDGSVIYDEYPDKWMLYKLGQDIKEILKTEEKQALGVGQDCAALEEKWEWLGDMIQILLFYEIYRKRHNRKRSYLKF